MAVYRRQVVEYFEIVCLKILPSENYIGQFLLRQSHICSVTVCLSHSGNMYIVCSDLDGVSIFSCSCIVFILLRMTAS